MEDRRNEQGWSAGGSESSAVVLGWKLGIVFAYETRDKRCDLLRLSPFLLFWSCSLSFHSNDPFRDETCRLPDLHYTYIIQHSFRHSLKPTSLAKPNPKELTRRVLPPPCPPSLANLLLPSLTIIQHIRLPLTLQISLNLLPPVELREPSLEERERVEGGRGEDESSGEEVEEGEFGEGGLQKKQRTKEHVSMFDQLDEVEGERKEEVGEREVTFPSGVDATKEPLGPLELERRCSYWERNLGRDLA